MQGYRQDLAYIHDVGFTDFARNAAPGLLNILKRKHVADGLVVDLGCGSGRWTAQLIRAGYHVWGVDQSRAMIRLARGNAPRSKFKIGSLLRVELPRCDAVTSTGECLNYTFDERNSHAALLRLFRRVYRALRPGGVFVFDIAEPSRIPKTPERKWTEGRGWAILVHIEGNRSQKFLRRRIVTFRKLGSSYRRTCETHSLRLYRAQDLIRMLDRCGFRARQLSGYGSFRFPPGIAGVLAAKP
ncbi:MAG: methyltransferase domain-containing protein [Acidobacteriia bacterium]|nr:methyltransferase domain-containing protein [Terriglobia bacterium]